ncbi:MAG TPA: HEAT repeat domain-containing protein, partial [Gemmatimonadales bacterium]|nr:HEAT repeat domain-containing protein [Gemmatimonadales bacterium]
ALGLASPSYQDVIQEAAFRVIAQTGDTGALPRVEALLGSGRLPAHVIAALAARGSAHALDVLTTHLDDDRPYVRHWVVEAFRFTLPRQLSLTRLQSVAGRLKYADTKKDVETAVQRLQKPETDAE